MAHAREPGRSACLQRRACLCRVRDRHRQWDSHRAGLRRCCPAPRGHRRHREVGGIRRTREGVRPRVQVPTASTKFSYLNWPTKRLVVDVTRHRSHLIVALLCAAQFMLILDIAIVNVALPLMQRTLGLSAENIQWVVGGYALTFGGFLMLGGRLADVIGRRRMFLMGLVLFIGASMLGGFSRSGGMPGHSGGMPGHRRLASERTGAPALRAALIAWLEASSGDSEITSAGRSKPASAWASGSARSVPWP